MSEGPSGLVRVVVGGATAGTGFLVSGDGLIVTCTHVLSPAEDVVSVVFRFGPSEGRAILREVRVEAELTRPSEAEDVAFLRLCDPVPDGVEAFVLGTSRPAVGATFRTFGFPDAKPDEGMAGEVRVTGTTAEGGFEALQLRSDEVSRGFDGAPVWDERHAVVGMVTGVADPDGLGRLSEVSFARPAEQLIGLYPALRPDPERPYRGLEVFEEEHAGDFFGRERAEQELLRTLAARDFVAVVGVSGSGKSSLVRAGLAQGLERFPVPGLIERRRCVVVPGSAPLLDVVLALADVVGGAAVSSAFGLRAGALDDPRSPLREVGDELGRMAPDALARALAGLGALVVVDQFERVFTEAVAAGVRDHFVDVLVAACGSGVKVVVTLRADFYGLALTSRLGELLGAGQLTLAPMSDDELVRAIEEPARRRGRCFEAGLVDRLIADVRGRPGDLPLLEFALEQLWARDAGAGVLRAATYESLGYRGPDGRVFAGVQGAIAKRAEQVWDALDGEERVAARRVFLSVVGAAGTGGGEGSPDVPSRRAWLRELGPAERAVAEKLAAARLLTLGRDRYSGQATIEVAHEALIRAWPLLAQWASSFRPFIRWRDRELDGLWRSWVAHDEDRQLLLPFAMLDEARRWLDDYAGELSASHVRYIEASLEARKAHIAAREAELARTRRLNRRLRALAWGLGAVVVIALAATILAISQSDKTRQQARVGTSRLLSFEAEARARSDPSLSMLLSLAANNSAETSQSRNGVQGQLIRQRHVRRILTAPSGAVTTLAHSPDGRLLAAGGPRAISVWDLRATRPPRLLPRPQGGVSAISFSRDKHLLAAGGARGIAVYDLSRPLAPQLTYASGDRVASLAITPDARTLVYAATKAAITIHQLATGRRATIAIPGATRVDKILTTPDSRHAIVLTDAGATSYDLATRRARHRYPFDRKQPQRGDLALAGHGRTLATITPGAIGGAELWNVATGARIESAGKGPYSPPIAFDPGGETLAAALGGGESIQISAYPVTADGFVEDASVELGERADVSSLAYSPDGRTLASGSADATVTLWDVASRETISDPRAADISTVAFDSTGKTLALGGIPIKHADKTNQVAFVDVARRRIRHRSCGLYAAARARTSSWAIDGQCEGVVGSALAVIDPSRRGDKLVTLLRPSRASRQLYVASGIRFSPDGRLIAERVHPYRNVDADNFTVFDSELLVWDAKRPRAPVARLKVGAPGVLASNFAEMSFAFSADGRTLAIARSYERPPTEGGNDFAIVLWDTRRRRTTATIKLDRPPDSLAFDPSGGRLAVGLKGRVELWRTSDRRRVAVINDVRGGATQVGFTPDGRRLAVADVAGVQLWSLDPIAKFGVRLPGNEGSEVVVGVAFALSPDGRSVAVVDGSEAAVVWSLEPAAWRRRLCAMLDRDLTRAERARYLPPDQRAQRTCPKGATG